MRPPSWVPRPQAPQRRGLGPTLPPAHLPPNTHHLNGRSELGALLSQRPRGRQGAEGRGHRGQNRTPRSPSHSMALAFSLATKQGVSWS